MKRAARVLLFIAYLFVIFSMHGQGQGLGALLDRAGAAQTAGDYGRAATLYRRAATLSPGTAELWSNLGVMEFFRGSWILPQRTFATR